MVVSSACARPWRAARPVCRFPLSLFDQAVKAWSSGIRENQEPQTEMVMKSLELLGRWLPRIGPYVVVEIVLPGGTLIALLLYLYRRRADKSAMPMSIWRAADRLKGVWPRVPRTSQ